MPQAVRRALAAVWLLSAVAGALPAQTSSPSDDVSLRAYRCQWRDAAGIAEQLQAEFRADRRVRVAADVPHSQVLVQAPLAVQSAIAGRIQALDRPPAEASARPDGSESGPVSVPRIAQAAATHRVVPLRRITPALVEEELGRVFAGRITELATSGPQVGRYRLDSASGQSVELSIDRQANQVSLAGGASIVEGMARLVAALDAARPAPGQSTRVVPVRGNADGSVRRLASLVRGAAGSGGRNVRMPMVAMLFQQPGEEEPGPAAESGEEPIGPLAGAAPGEPPPAVEPGAGGGEGGAEGEASLVGSVQVEILEGLDVVIIRGLQRDVDRVIQIVEQIERLSGETEPAIEVYPLRHVDSAALAELIIPLYEQVFIARQGSVSITALVKPNALLLIGRAESVQRVIELVEKLDRPVAPSAQFQVFRLRHLGSDAAQATVNQFFAARGGLGPRVLAVSDFRSNALVVQASPRDLAEVAALLARIDTPVSEAVNEIRVFPLEHSLATELAPLLQQALSGGAAAARAPGAVAPAAPTTAGAAAAAQRSVMLRLLTTDADGRRRLESGILSDVRITADARANAVIVSAPAESMELIGALVREMDRLPTAEAQIKVFTIVNGDASALVEMLQTLFPQQQQGAAGFPAAPVAAAEGESSLVALRFAVDLRTNSVIATGSRGDLEVVEAILLRLDASDIRQRRTVVYRLKNSPAAYVAQAINDFLRSERQVQQLSPGLMSPFEQIEREVVVVPETVSNSLIVSATPRYFEEIRQVVEQLDERPPMVMIQVLIAEVALNNTDELGIELGLQDSILFNRSLLENITTLSQTTYNTSGNPASTNETIASATYTPGFAFNNQPLGQTSGAGLSRLIGTQGISHFGVSRLNSELGYGGFVFQASSESVSVLIRALKDCRRLEVLSRPQVMTLDNQPAFIQVGQRVPRITGTQVNQTGQVNNITLENVGLILGVTPRISPDGLVVMEIDAEKSELGPEAEGIPVSISATGQVIRSPRINTTTAQTTVSAASGQTVVLGGLITKSQTDITRKVPGLGDVPVVGMLFRYDAKVVRRSELLIIMTPHVVRNENDAERIKKTEAARMHWCLSDIVAVSDDPSLRSRGGEWSDSETRVIYPDLDPTGRMTTGGAAMPQPEMITAPPGVPAESTQPSIQPLQLPEGELVEPPAGQTTPNPPGRPALPIPSAEPSGAGSPTGAYRPILQPQAATPNTARPATIGMAPATAPGGATAFGAWGHRADGIAWPPTSDSAPGTPPPATSNVAAMGPPNNAPGEIVPAAYHVPSTTPVAYSAPSSAPAAYGAAALAHGVAPPRYRVAPTTLTAPESPPAIPNSRAGLASSRAFDY